MPQTAYRRARPCPCGKKAAGGSALDAVTEAVRLPEDCELFNAGKGAVYTQAGAVALDTQGGLALPFNTEGMYRGYVRGGEAPVTAIYR